MFEITSGGSLMSAFESYYPRLCGWFPDIPPSVIHSLVLRQFEAGDLIVRKDDFFRNIYIILDGVCNVISQLDNGAEVITLKLTPGYLIGVSESVLAVSRNIASVKACTALIVVELPDRTFQEWLTAYPSFMRFVLQNLVSRLHYTADFAANCRTSASRVNLAKYLMERYNLELVSLPDGYSGSVRINETHEMMADFLGVGTRTVDRQILALKSDGFISISRGKISISPSQYQLLVQFVTSNL